jgi:hypothetical protein
VPHLAHLRLRHTRGCFLLGRELATAVVELKQFMQNMTIYCHTALKKASGKHKNNGDKKSPPL